MGELDGRVALVTGAGQGAGMGIAVAMAAAGASVAVVGRTESKLRTVAGDIEGDGGRAVAVQCDGAKEAIVSVTRAAAVEWGPEGIRANVILPHVTSPSMEAELSDPRRRASSLASIPLGRFGMPEDIGNVAVFLASPAAAFITGQM